MKLLASLNWQARRNIILSVARYCNRANKNEESNSLIKKIKAIEFDSDSTNRDDTDSSSSNTSSPTYSIESNDFGESKIKWYRRPICYPFDNSIIGFKSSKSTQINDKLVEEKEQMLEPLFVDKINPNYLRLLLVK